ncbi:MAG: molybdopterin molybdotransferase MoeA [Rhodobiaceae bacterium]|nr:molybdopterin molybdotransferase MoeA [Rhodobiaceae bacterium]MCC0018364.1 molybdopterin molybdotransferase MoeA [Rhodobiaceae bacterium]MCC0051157.1 molybdopterin molybdotransferase MoeA [Rhodobiaceae bacterium]MCC0060222.1 molybdopterin molybdotransferase MoeA [Rhodobiaceae bacterium]
MTAKKLLDDCFLHDKDRLRHDEVLAILRERLANVATPEDVPLGAATGRVAANDVRAPRNVPAFDNSAVDGYAVRHADLNADADTSLFVAMRVAAGHPANEPLPEKSAARIFTGAPMPAGADTVVMQEDCEAAASDEIGELTQVTIPAGVKPGANRRRAGEDLAEGATLIDPGQRLRPQDIAAAASIGHGSLSVFSKLKVAVFSSGDEIAEAGTELGDGGVYDANRPLLTSLLSSLPVEVNDLGILPDTGKAMRDALSKAERTADVIITSGGASRGEEDHLIESLDKLGKRHLWQIAIKPGRPMAMGQIGDTVVFGLPGNPVAAFVCFLLYVRPALLALGGARWSEPRRFMLPAAFEIPKKKPDRREFLRGLLTPGPDGLNVDKFARDGSGLITGLRAADGLIEIPEDATSVTRGEPVAFIPFGELGL